MRTEEIMTKKVISCHKDKTVLDAAEIMLGSNIGCLPIVDNDNNLVGMISESDFIGTKVDIPHAMVSLTELFGETIHDESIDEVFHHAKHKPISEVMKAHQIFPAKPDMTITEISHIMLENNINRMPVVTDGKLVGIITKRDILRAFLKTV